MDAELAPKGGDGEHVIYSACSYEQKGLKPDTNAKDLQITLELMNAF